MADGVKTDGLFDGLGSDFYIMGQYIKFHAACRHIHPAIDGLLDIMRKENLSYQEIDALNITTYPVAISFCGTSSPPETAESCEIQPRLLMCDGRFLWGCRRRAILFRHGSESGN